MDPDRYRYAKLRYARMRREAYAAVQADEEVGRIAGIPFRLADIDAHTLAVRERTWLMPHPSGSGGWDWRILTDRVRADAAAFKAALWSQGVLCGLALGRPSNRAARGTRNRLSMHYLEGNPDSRHPLKGAVSMILLNAAQVYAGALGASSIRLVDPLPGALHVYLELGFEVERTADGMVYCVKEISR